MATVVARTSPQSNSESVGLTCPSTHVSSSVSDWARLDLVYGTATRSVADLKSRAAQVLATFPTP